MSRLKKNNVDFILAFVRNVDREMRDSDKYAMQFSDGLKGLILDRVARGEYLAGDWKSKPYSSNPIKAYKLGAASVTGEGMGRQLTINGIVIDNEDWYWGKWDMEKKGIQVSNPSPLQTFGDYTPKPVPVFVPGYRSWRVEYNAKSDQVDLNFSGAMLENLDVDTWKRQGSNQYGGRYSFDFVVDEPFMDIGDITDYYRRWLVVTEEEMMQAANEVGQNIMDILIPS